MRIANTILWDKGTKYFGVLFAELRIINEVLGIKFKKE